MWTGPAPTTPNIESLDLNINHPISKNFRLFKKIRKFDLTWNFRGLLIFSIEIQSLISYCMGFIHLHRERSYMAAESPYVTSHVHKYIYIYIYICILVLPGPNLPYTFCTIQKDTPVEEYL